jgi:hypothetical protein|tara:strand:- start:774 stop:1193 length:420 start_codon:yes stop_codon:yes gene_type:complete
MDLLPHDILYIIFSKLDPIEANNLSNTCKILKDTYNYLEKYNKYINIYNHNILKNKIKNGYRYLQINNKNYKIINIIQYYEPYFNIIFTNGNILHISEDKINLFNYKKFNKKIKRKNIKLITESKFNYKIKSINLNKYY